MIDLAAARRSAGRARQPARDGALVRSDVSAPHSAWPTRSADLTRERAALASASGLACGLPGSSVAVEELLKSATLILARLAEACGAVVIGYAVIRAAALFVVDAIRGPTGSVPNEAIRLSLGRSLALGLEFLLGADILNTAVAPSWEQVGLLAAIAAIRTGLNYFLQQELDRAFELEGKRQAQEAQARAPRPPDQSASIVQRGG